MSKLQEGIRFVAVMPTYWIYMAYVNCDARYIFEHSSTLNLRGKNSLHVRLDVCEITVRVIKLDLHYRPIARETNLLVAVADLVFSPTFAGGTVCY